MRAIPLKTSLNHRWLYSGLSAEIPERLYSNIILWCFNENHPRSLTHSLLARAFHSSLLACGCRAKKQQPNPPPRRHSSSNSIRSRCQFDFWSLLRELLAFLQLNTREKLKTSRKVIWTAGSSLVIVGDWSLANFQNLKILRTLKSKNFFVSQIWSHKRFFQQVQSRIEDDPKRTDQYLAISLTQVKSSS